MKFLVMIYCDDALLDALPAGEFDTLMHGCFMHADELHEQGHLHGSQQLEAPATARTLRARTTGPPSSTGRSPKPRNTWAAST